MCPSPRRIGSGLDKTGRESHGAPAGQPLLIAVVALSWGAMRWPRGLSLFGFESPYWDLGLLPILSALLLVPIRFRSSGKRFLTGFEVCGVAATIAYSLSCMRPAKWSIVSVLLPFQTGYLLAPGRRTTLGDLKPWGIFVDTVILVLLPLLPAILGGVIASVRITLRRLMVSVAVLAIIFGAPINTIRRARHYDRLGLYHRKQVVGQVWSRIGPDGKQFTEISAIDRKGKAVSPRQQKVDRWHEAMAQKYWHAPYYPWSAAPKKRLSPE
jgi:hypothetical protein